jgi:hypothetical protein
MGAPFYVMTPVPPPGKPDAVSDLFSVDGPQHIRWNELCSPDVARARAFYARHFGFQFNESMPMGPQHGDYLFIDHGGLRVGLRPLRSPVPAGLPRAAGVAAVLLRRMPHRLGDHPRRRARPLLRLRPAS